MNDDNMPSRFFIKAQGRREENHFFFRISHMNRAIALFYCSKTRDAVCIFYTYDVWPNEQMIGSPDTPLPISATVALTTASILITLAGDMTAPKDFCCPP